MKPLLQTLKSNPLFRAAILVPTSIFLIFSLFNLTAPPNPVAQAASFRLGIVNLDEGAIFPPIKVSEKVAEGLLGSLPFTVIEIETKEVARLALENGNVAAVLIFPKNFTKLAMSDEQVSFEIWNSQHLTIAETAMGAQLPMMLELGMSAGVASLRASLAAGKLPSDELPVKGVTETFHQVQSSPSLVAPFVMTSTTWLAAMVGAIILFLALKNVTRGVPKAMVRTVLPIGSMGLASLVLAIVISTTIGDWGLLLPVWISVWVAAVCINWLITGLFSIFGMYALILALPAAFYQPAIGGVQAPISAAPNWLTSIAEIVPFEMLGAGYRHIILGGGTGMPFGILAAVGAGGLVLIWLGSNYMGKSEPS